jgi:hypothetical protein
LDGSELLDEMGDHDDFKYWALIQVEETAGNYQYT